MTEKTMEMGRGKRKRAKNQTGLAKLAALRLVRGLRRENLFLEAYKVIEIRLIR